MAEILEFRVPTGPGRTLLVLGLETDATEHALYLALSAFGPLYSVRLHRNAAVAGPGYYALVKYYSARDASRAQLACHRQPLFQKSALKVTPPRSLGLVVFMTHTEPLTPQTSLQCDAGEGKNAFLHAHVDEGTPSYALQDISGFEAEEENEGEDSGALPESQCCKYLCIQELTLPQHGICARGIGVAETPVDPSQENGKVAVEFVSPQEDLVDCLADEELKGLLQVTDLSFSQLNPEGEEEALSDFSMDGE
ncbi:PREDICTED: RAD52 motif-containing protein 1 [Gekko japonicus]|uniref:RAD52 motif-containing protein 1 n=1 Tax=Gekko japonicus TaxID=146911 RepID=A0ABM1JX05_GEKJA|nr:PREDICTED: RAD52 motif-containing protein 1 [Gekko japonicus]